MSAANVKFATLDKLIAEPGREETFSFDCPKHKGRRCESLIIRGRTTLKWDPQNKNGGIAQWSWDGNRDAPTFAPSINCGGCWHGYIQRGRCVNCAKQDEPEPR